MEMTKFTFRTPILEVKKQVNSLNDAKELIRNMQQLSKALFFWAWQNHVHRELALYSMSLRDEKDDKADGSTLDNSRD